LSALVIESSARPAQVALSEDDGSFHTVDRGSLAAGVAELVADWSRITRYGLSVGPGSFTGLRVGLSLLKGLAFVHPRPVACVSSLRLWAASVDALRVAAVLDARRERVFMGLYEGGAVLVEEAARPVAEAKALLEEQDCVLVGDGAALLGLWHPVAPLARPSVEALAQLVRDTPESALRAAIDVEPRYLLRTEVEERLGPAGSGN